MLGAAYGVAQPGGMPAAVEGQDERQVPADDRKQSDRHHETAVTLEVDQIPSAAPDRGINAGCHIEVQFPWPGRHAPHTHAAHLLLNRQFPRGIGSEHVDREATRDQAGTDLLDVSFSAAHEGVAASRNHQDSHQAYPPSSQAVTPRLCCW